MSTIAIGSDHAGFELKTHFVEVLSGQGHTIIDHGTDSTVSVDYPPICAAVGRSVRDGDAEVGIVVGGSGQGEQLAANKVRGCGIQNGPMLLRIQAGEIRGVGHRDLDAIDGLFDAFRLLQVDGGCR